MKQQNFSQAYGPWAIVTGASSGIGEEFARQLAAIGLNLILVARRKSRLDELGQQLKQQFAIQTRSVQADLSQAEGIAAVETATDDLEIGLLVSNAGTALAGAFLKLDPDAAARMIHLNATAHMRLSHFFGQKNDTAWTWRHYFCLFHRRHTRDALSGKLFGSEGLYFELR